MLVFYGDDSGEDCEPIVMLGGHITTAKNWAAFEARAKPVLAREGVTHLHAVDLHHLRNEFKDWDRPRALAFATELFDILGDYGPLATEFTVLKRPFNENRKHKPREGAAITFCFKGLLQNLFSDEAMKAAMALNGVSLSFVIEGGKRMIPIEKEFIRLKDLNAFEGKLHSFALEDKKGSIGLQMADFYVYWRRRLRLKDKAHKRFSDEYDFFRSATKAIPIQHGFLATEFS